jgi:hypothetical protein
LSPLPWKCIGFSAKARGNVFSSLSNKAQSMEAASAHMLTVIVENFQVYVTLA